MVFPKSRGKYDAGTQGSVFSYSTRTKKTRTREAEEEFYGFDLRIIYRTKENYHDTSQGDFFIDLQEEFRNWEEIGEGFVEFLEKELNITDSEGAEDNDEKFTKGFSPNETKEAASANQTEPNKASSIDEIEAALAQLKKELGLE